MRTVNADSDSTQNLKASSQPDSRPPSAAKSLLWMILSITLVIAVTEISDFYFRPSEPTEGLVHILVLFGVLAPLFYFLWFRPIRQQMLLGRAREEEIRSLSHRLIAVGEAERRKLARDLHDEFGQKLTSLQVLIDSLERSLAKAEPPPPNMCQLLKDVVTRLSKNLRTVLADLRPSTLDDLGLALALESLCSEVADQQPDLKVDFRSAGIQGRLTPDLETALFRACQEALTNVVKHAHADLVEVRLTRCHPHIILTIQDNGTGFGSAETGPLGSGVPGHFGLLGMRERIAAVGGSIALSSNPAGGARIRIEVPEPVLAAVGHGFQFTRRRLTGLTMGAGKGKGNHTDP